MFEAAAIWLGLLGFQLAVLEWGPKVYFGEGWLVPHSEPQPDCRVNCATCRETT